MSDSKVYIIILNYKGWQDTIECLESVLRNDYPNYQVIVIDNNSPDNSLEYIKSWTEGKLDIWVNPKHPLRNLSFPPIKKPIPYVFYLKEFAEKGGDPEEEEINKNFPNNTTSSYPLILIKSEENRGYSAGNNIGIRYALSKNDFEYIWLLNNDTVIKKDSLVNLIKCVENKDDKISPLGSVLLYYDKPELIQALGGKFSKLKALGSHFFAKKTFNENLKKSFNINEIDYIIGASMLLKKEFLKEVGLLNEEYFIYFEEIDLSMRGEKKGYKLDMCLESVVYHKEATTMKSMPSDISYFYATRNRIIFTKKYYPYLLPVLYLIYPLSIFKRLKRKEFKKALNILKIMFGKSKYG